MEHALPLVERELVHVGGRLRDDGAPADRVDQDIDASVLVDDLLHGAGDLRGVERVGDQTVGGATLGSNAADHLIQALLVDLDADDRAALSRDDLGSRPADASAHGGDQRGPSLESHVIPLLVGSA